MMGKFKDLTGQRFGRLTVVERAENKGTSTAWLCQCDCGNMKIATSTGLQSGDTTSCGCKRSPDITGKVFGRLKAVERVRINGAPRYRCICECGNEVFLPLSALTSGNTTSCGCAKRDILIKRNQTHNCAHKGSANYRYYREWCAMKERCERPENKCYHLYGGRGIHICDDWRNSFQTFLNDISTLEHFGEAGYTLDRIDCDKGYRLDNCRFADSTLQAQNQRVRNKYGVAGVRPYNDKFTVSIGVNGHMLYLGICDTIDEARQIRHDAELKYWGWAKTEVV